VIVVVVAAGSIGRGNARKQSSEDSVCGIGIPNSFVGVAFVF
jgi:hypothetical protein